mmetsp:Transcript_11279/g.28429  ORF Transcript_11279/g.28429 Transcript_11279/m.28429 type:complete len:238 (-) Transcript_11279:211-924(-)
MRRPCRRHDVAKRIALQFFLRLKRGTPRQGSTANALTSPSATPSSLRTCKKIERIRLEVRGNALQPRSRVVRSLAEVCIISIFLVGLDSNTTSLTSLNEVSSHSSRYSRKTGAASATDSRKFSVLRHSLRVALWAIAALISAMATSPLIAPRSSIACISEAALRLPCSSSCSRVLVLSSVSSGSRSPSSAAVTGSSALPLLNSGPDRSSSIWIWSSSSGMRTSLGHSSATVWNQRAS